ncbi:MAG: ubiquinol-cytochrome c reductase iron-sulfur subunit [Blastocatellia bacterium]
MAHAHHPEHPSNDAPTERRSFLGFLSMAIGGLISAVLGINIGRFAIGPAFSGSDEGTWLDLGKLADIPEGAPVKRSVIVSKIAGWGKFNDQRLVWITRKGNEVKCFTAVCPHLGCTVNARGENFVCACHNSEWSTAGALKGGPSPRDLDTLEHKVEGEALRIKYEDYKQGISQKEVV